MCRLLVRFQHGALAEGSISFRLFYPPIFKELECGESTNHIAGCRTAANIGLRDAREAEAQGSQVNPYREQLSDSLRAVGRVYFKAGRMSLKDWVELVPVNASTADDRKLLALELMKARPFLSDLAIAKASNLSDKTVRRIRSNELVPTREEAIKTFIEANGHLPNSELSQLVGVSRQTIGKYRKELSNV